MALDCNREQLRHKMFATAFSSIWQHQLQILPTNYQAWCLVSRRLLNGMSKISHLKIQTDLSGLITLMIFIPGNTKAVLSAWMRVFKLLDAAKQQKMGSVCICFLQIPSIGGCWPWKWSVPTFISQRCAANTLSSRVSNPEYTTHWQAEKKLF